jgi:hypothetical protein
VKAQTIKFNIPGFFKSSDSELSVLLYCAADFFTVIYRADTTYSIVVLSVSPLHSTSSLLKIFF